MSAFDSWVFDQMEKRYSPEGYEEYLQQARELGRTPLDFIEWQEKQAFESELENMEAI